MNFLDNSTLWVGVSFILFLTIVIKPLLRLINNTITIKVKEIKEKIDEAEKLKSEAEKILNDLKKKKFQGDSDINKIINQSKTEAKDIEDRMKKTITDTISKKEYLLEQKLKQTKLKFEKEISNEILETALIVTKKRIIKNLSEEKKNSLIKKSINELDIKIN